MAKPRIQIAYPGDYYQDLLKIDARINGRSIPQQAQSLLCAKLQEREQRIKERVRYLAKRKGVPEDAMWDHLLSDEEMEEIAPTDEP